MGYDGHVDSAVLGYFQFIPVRLVHVIPIIVAEVACHVNAAGQRRGFLPGVVRFVVIGIGRRGGGEHIVQRVASLAAIAVNIQVIGTGGTGCNGELSGILLIAAPHGATTVGFTVLVNHVESSIVQAKCTMGYDGHVDSAVLGYFQFIPVRLVHVIPIIVAEVACHVNAAGQRRGFLPGVVRFVVIGIGRRGGGEHIVQRVASLAAIAVNIQVIGTGGTGCNGELSGILLIAAPH